jgi:hypothetical protein
MAKSEFGSEGALISDVHPLNIPSKHDSAVSNAAISGAITRSVQLANIWSKHLFFALSPESTSGTVHSASLGNGVPELDELEYPEDPSTRDTAHP